jgi:hypothetical protein
MGPEGLQEQRLPGHSKPNTDNRMQPKLLLLCPNRLAKYPYVHTAGSTVFLK